MVVVLGAVLHGEVKGGRRGAGAGVVGLLSGWWLLFVPGSMAAAWLLYPVLVWMAVPVALGVAYAVVLLMFAWFLVVAGRSRGVGPAALGLRGPIRLSLLLVALGSFVVLGGAWQPVSALVGFWGWEMMWPSRAAAAGSVAGAWRGVILVVVGVVVVPLLEEFLYRGFVQSWLVDRTGSVVGAIALTSVLWGATHVALGLGIMVYAGVMGVAVGALYHWTRSLVYPSVVHVANNGFAYLVVPLAFG